MRITFYGAAGGVTGSKHLVQTGKKKFLFDCGTFQGLQDVRGRNRQLPFDAKTINFVILSHSHIDHCGMLPLLVKQGFGGHIFATAATRDVTRYMLDDVAGIEVQDAGYRKKHGIGSREDQMPLFTPDDIPAVMQRFITVPYARHGEGWQNVEPGIRIKMYDAGHILGSAVSVVEVDDEGVKKVIAYTGDLGPKNVPLLFDPVVPKEKVDTLISESTYGGRTHEPNDQAFSRLAEQINKVVDRGGKIVMPAFSLGRTQLIVYLLHKLTLNKKIPDLPIYVDSPLATNLTEVFRDHEKEYDSETWQDFEKGNKKPFDFKNLTYIASVQESKRLNSKKGPFIIISASGMMTAGRVVHHLRHTIEDSRNAIFITGYQAEGTLGRRIMEGAKQVEIYGDRFNVRAEVEVFNEFSAHADSPQLVDYIQRFKGIKNVILVHGEPGQANRLKSILKSNNPTWRLERPDEGDSIEI